jgi:hypothetical protein
VFPPSVLVRTDQVLLGTITVTYFAGGKARLTAEIRHRAQRRGREEILGFLFFSAVSSVAFSAVDSSVRAADKSLYLRHRPLRSKRFLVAVLVAVFPRESTSRTLLDRGGPNWRDCLHSLFS